jgi:glycosyltransferase involved in cell wall biosynthesis
LCVSEGTRRSVVEAGVPPARVHVLPNIVSSETIRFRPSARVDGRAALGLPPDAFVVGCMTRFHPKKRNDVLIDAVLMLDDPRLHLVFAGAGETEGELRRRASPLGERAHFLPTPGDAASDVISAWDLAAFCPSPTEGAPLAIIVPMLCERPVLSTGAEGALDLIRPGTGVIAQPDHEPAAVAAEIAAYRDDPERMRTHGNQARLCAAELHDADAVAARAEALLTSSPTWRAH